jgi:cytochrome c oxidase assembly protein subunit 15
METSLPRLRRLAVSTRVFRRLALANALMLMVIVASGATVRLTGSGLGCEHWPGCTAGDFFPKNGYYSYVEFSNRVVSGLTIAVTLATWLAALLLPTARRWVRWVAGGTFLGTLLQAPLGAITVYYHLNPWLVGTHFLVSLTVLTLGVVVVLEAYGVKGEEVPVRLKQLALVAAASCGALVVTGTLSTAAGPHSGSVDVPRIGSFQPAVWLHVRATAVFGITFAVLLIWLIVRRSRYVWAAGVVLGLLAAQMAVGEIQYRVNFGGVRLPWWLVLVHVTLSAAVWAATSALVATFWRPSRMR